MLCNYPLLFEKNIHTLVWGTEAWEVSAVPSSPCIVANGPLKGRDIISVIDEYGPDILGDAVYEEFGGKLPLFRGQQPIPHPVQVHAPAMAFWFDM